MKRPTRTDAFLAALAHDLATGGELSPHAIACARAPEVELPVGVWAIQGLAFGAAFLMGWLLRGMS